MQRIRRIAPALGLAAFLSLAMVTNAFAAAEPTTGVDWKVDVADPVLAAIKPALLAGIVIMVMFAAVAGATKLWGKVTKTK